MTAEQIQDLTSEQQIHYWTGQIAISIGAGTTRHTVWQMRDFYLRVGYQNAQPPPATHQYRVRVGRLPDASWGYTVEKAARNLAEQRYEFTDEFVIHSSRQLNTQQVAEEVFDLTNSPAREQDREQVAWQGPSVSPGDIVQVADQLWLCCQIGWKSLCL